MGDSVSRPPRREPRSYRMRRRAEQVDQTRLRIVKAAVGLHGTVGPSATTVAGIAEAAGVTRATVYRYFPDDAALFEACSAHWLHQQVPPDPSSWAAVADPLERMTAGLADLYRFYRAGQAMLSLIHRDQASLPDSRRRELAARDRQFRDVLLAGFPPSHRTRKHLVAVLGHAVAYTTWQSLCIEQRLADHDAVELMEIGRA